MADPQIKNGYTRIANELLEAICRLNISGNEMRILLYIIRRTYGFNRSYAEIPLSDISEALGMRKNHISEALKRLTVKKIVELHPNKGTKPQTISIVKNYEKWVVESCANLPFPKTGTVPENGNPTVPENGNPTVPENGNHTYKEKKKIINKGEIKKPHGRYSNVLLSDDEIIELNRDYGEDNVERYIQKIDSYVQSKNKPFADYDAALRKWLDEDDVKAKKNEGFDASLYDWAINNF